MGKKGIAFCLFLLLILTLCGCSTISCTAKGAGEGAAIGFSNDMQSLKNMDSWIRQNLW